MPFQNMPFTGGNFEFKVIKRAYTKTKGHKGTRYPSSSFYQKGQEWTSFRVSKHSLVIYHGVGTGQENPQHMRMCIKYPPKMHNTYA